MVNYSEHNLKFSGRIEFFKNKPIIISDETNPDNIGIDEIKRGLEIALEEKIKGLVDGYIISIDHESWTD